MSEKWDSNSSENWHYIWSVNGTKYHLYSDINITYVNYYLHQPQVAAVFITSYFLIFFLCMVGNTVVCFTVMRNKHMHTVTNLFILNLAISDLLVGIFCMPITLLDNIIAGMLTCVLYKDDIFLPHSCTHGRVIHSSANIYGVPRTSPGACPHRAYILKEEKDNKQMEDK